MDLLAGLVLPIPILCCNADGTVKQANLAAMEFFSASPVGRAKMDLFPNFPLTTDRQGHPWEIRSGSCPGCSRLLCLQPVPRKSGPDAEAKLRAFFDSAPDAILLVDSQGRIDMSNSLAEKLFGYSSGLLGRKVEELIPGRFRHSHVGHRASYEAHRSSRAMSSSAELWGLRQDGSEFPVDIALGPMDLEAGKFVCCSVRDVSERRKADEAQAYLAALVESSEDAIIGLTLEGLVTSWNRGAERMFGYTASEMLGQPLHILSPGELLNEELEIHRQLSAGQQVDHWETRRRHKDGRLIDISITASEVRDGLGRRLGFSKTARDITQRKRTERELLAARDALSAHERMSAIFNSAFHFMGLLTVDGLLLEANDTALEFAQVEKSQVIGRYFWDTPWWDHSQELQAELRAAIAEAALGKRVELQVSHPRPGGGLAAVEFSLRPLLDEDGQVRFLIPEGRDVTRERETRIELALSEARFRQAFEYAGLGMALVGLDGRWIKVNSALCAMVGYSEAELAQLTFQDITHPEDLAGDLLNVQALLDGEMPFYQMEKRYLHKDGQVIWILLTASLVRSAKGEPDYFISQIQDITQGKKSEASLRLSLAEKEVMIREIHHRVKNNLQIVTSLINLQANRIVDPAVAEVLEDCRARVQSMALVHERLYSSGSLSHLDMGGHLRELARLIAESSAHPAHLEFDMQSVEVDVNSAIPLGLFATEVVSNAFKHAFANRAEAGRLLICLREQDSLISLEISDDGPGLPTDATMHSKPPSLGLKLLNTFARQLRGQLEIGRGPLGGARFQLTFDQMWESKVSLDD